MRESACHIAADIAARRRTAVDVCRETLARIDVRDPRIRAFLEVTSEHALERAAGVDADLAAGKTLGPLAGVPLALKDNICTNFGHTTCGSKALQNYESPFSATVVERVEAAGGVIVGKTNLDEFAMGSSGENSAFLATRNPWNEQAVPGGSSAGAAAAVAADIVPVALGSDTGGSIRQPAALCGVVGLKPTYGRVPRWGLVAYGSSLDQIGPLAGGVEDAALLLGVISGSDPRDATSARDPVPNYRDALIDRELAKLAGRLRIGVPREYLAPGLEADTQAAVEEALRVYQSIGATIVDVSLPRSSDAIAAYYLVATAEASSNLARFDGVHYGHRTSQPEDIDDLVDASRDEGFGPEVKRRIMLGTFALSAGYYEAYYLKALKVRRLIKRDFDQAFAKCDVVVGPTSPTPAFPLGERTDDPLAMYLADVYTVALNLAGLPGISIPCGFSHAGLPIGLQLAGPVFDDMIVLQTARLLERETDWHTRCPPLAR